MCVQEGEFMSCLYKRVCVFMCVQEDEFMSCLYKRVSCLCVYRKMSL